MNDYIAIDAYVATQVLPQYHDVTGALRALMRECAPNVNEAFSYNMPVWVGRRMIAYMNGNRKGVTFSFVHGAALTDGAGLLKGTGKNARFVSLKSVAELRSREAALRDLIRQALEIDAGA